MLRIKQIFLSPAATITSPEHSEMPEAAQAIEMKKTTSKDQAETSSFASPSPLPIRRHNTADVQAEQRGQKFAEDAEKGSLKSNQSRSSRFSLQTADSPRMEPRRLQELAQEVEPHQRSILKGSQGYRVRPQLEKRLSFDTSIADGATERYGDRLRRNLANMRASTDALDEKSPNPLPTPVSTRSKFHQSFYWLALNHRRLGLSHFAMFALLATYSLLGAVAFYLSEHQNEIDSVSSQIVEMREFYTVLADELQMRYNYSLAVNNSDIAVWLEDVYVRSLQQEGIYQWTTYYKAEDPDKNMKWTFPGAIFFTFNVFTTTGYGSITCQTVRGQFMTMVYGTLFIPVTLVIVRDIGQLFLVYLTKLYALCLISFRRARGLEEGEDHEIIRLPIFWSILTLMTFLGATTIILHSFDEAMGKEPNTGLNWMLSLYFAWVSTSTVGFGDVMPTNVTFNPLITMMFFFALPVMKVVNRITYVAIENGIFGTFTVLENRFDSWLHGELPQDVEARSRRSSVCSRRSARYDPEEEPDEGGVSNEWINNFTIRSIATFMKADGDVYAGGFGRVHLRKGDLVQTTPQDTIASSRSRSSNR